MGATEAAIRALPGTSVPPHSYGPEPRTPPALARVRRDSDGESGGPPTDATASAEGGVYLLYASVTKGLQEPYAGLTSSE